MGPQLYRCGNANRCLRTCRRSPGFNGAATLSLRKREAGEGNPAWPFVLQWGRNFIVAEIGWPRHTAARSPTSFNGAATLSLRKCENDTIDTDSITLLQWGRNFIVAEMYYNAVHGMGDGGRLLGMPVVVDGGRGAGCTSCARQRSFNGAATLSLRKFKMVAYLEYPIAKLQWGRNFIVAEIPNDGSNY